MSRGFPLFEVRKQFQLDNAPPDSKIVFSKEGGLMLTPAGTVSSLQRVGNLYSLNISPITQRIMGRSKNMQVSLTKDLDILTTQHYARWDFQALKEFATLVQLARRLHSHFRPERTTASILFNVSIRTFKVHLLYPLMDSNILSCLLTKQLASAGLVSCHSNLMLKHGCFPNSSLNQLTKVSQFKL